MTAKNLGEPLFFYFVEGKPYESWATETRRKLGCKSVTLHSEKKEETIKGENHR